MPSKLQMYEQMADHTAKQITGSFGEWTAFLETAARLYKYPFHEQMMIYAQRPDATACAEYDLWNNQMRRYVRRGSKGIALIDTRGENPRLRYVFDVSDTGGRENSRRLYFWAYRDDHREAVSNALEQRFGVSGENGFADQLEQIAHRLVSEYWNDNSRDILGILEDSFLEEYDDFNVGVQFRNAATVSTTYLLMSRCGLNPGDYFEHEDFLSVFDFNTRDTIAALGSVISNTSEQVLRQIEVTIKHYEREASLQQQTERTSYAEHHDLQPERGLPNPESRTERDRAEAPGQVRQNAEGLPAAAQAGAVEQHDSVRDPVSASEGDRRDGEQPSGADDARADEAQRRDGGAESQRPDAVGGADEQSQGPGGGNHPERTDFQLNVTGEQITLFDVGLFPTEQEQIALIDEAERVGPTPFAFSFAQEDIDDVLRLASNSDNTRMEVAAAFQKQKPLNDIVALLQREYHGGAGLKSANGEFSVWYDQDGLHLAKGRSARYVKSAQVVSWEAAAERIGELLEEGKYASNVELAEAEGYERQKLAGRLLHLHGDLTKEAKEQGVLSVMDGYYQGGFPEAIEKLSERLRDPMFREKLASDYAAFLDAYGQDRSILRFHYHKRHEIRDAIRDLDLPRREYTSDMAEIPGVGMFITDDEIDATLSRGGNVEGGKGRIYGYLTGDHTTKEKTDFLKQEHGIGGSSHAVSGTGWVDYSGKGVKLRKDDCADVELNWSKVLSRFENLIRSDRYFTPEEKARYEEMQTREWQFRKHMDAYNGIKHDHPDDIVLFQVGDFFEMYGEGAKTASELLDLNLTTRAVPGAGRVEMCGIPASNLEQVTAKLRETHGVTVAEWNSVINEHISHSYAVLAPAEELSSEPKTAAESVTEAPIQHREITQAEIDAALQRWNGSIESKRAVVRYMTDHARERDTAVWLAQEYGIDGKKPLHITVTGTDINYEMSWPKVQRRIAQLIKEDRFLTGQERQSEPQSQENRPYQVVVYHHLENGFDEKKEYPTLEEAEKAAQSYVDGTMEPDGFAYDGAAVYDLEAGQYLRIYGDYPDEKAHEQLNEVAHPHNLQAEVEAWEAEQAAQKQAVIDTLSEQEQLTVRAMETAGFIFNPQAANPGLRENLVFTAGEYGYPITFENWEQAYMWIDGAELRDTPGLREQVQHILHPKPQNGVLTDEEYAVARGTIRERTSYDPTIPPYNVGDIVYLDDRAHQITELRDDTVELLPTGMSYPIYRAERQEQFEQLLRADNRNDFYTEFLPANPDAVDQDLRDVLAHGLIGAADKAELSELLRSGKSNREMALWLSRTYPNTVETIELETGDTADYRTTPEGIELEVLDAEEKRLAMLSFRWNEVAPLLRGLYARQVDGFGQERPEPAAEPPAYHAETVAVYPGDKTHLPYDVVVQTLRTNEPEPPVPAAGPEPPTPAVEPEKTLDEVLDEHPISIQVNGEWQTFPNVKAAEEASYEEYKANLRRTAENFRITDDHLGEGGPKAKFQANVEAIKLLKYLEETTEQATPEQQKILSRYVGWGGLADAFDPDKESWSKEYAQLKELLTPEEYAAARGSTLNAHYTSPTVIKAIYEAVGRMGFETGNILEPSMGVGNFFGCLPESMQNSRLYGVELDSITGRIAKQLYPKANITVAGFETTDRRDFYDLAIGNVPFGQYQVNDRAYNKLGFSIHDYFFAKTLDQVRPGGVIAFVTSRYTMDKQSPEVRKYIAQRAELLGAIRLPNNAFKANAGTEVVSDIIFLQKRDRPIEIEPDWVHLGQNADGFAINNYFIENPEMVLGRQTSENTQYGRQDFTVVPYEDLDLDVRLRYAIQNIRGTYTEAELPDLGEGEAIDSSIPADPDVKNYSYTVVDGEVYYRENSRMVKPDLNTTAIERVKGMVELRDCVQKLIAQQMDGYVPEESIRETQKELSDLYDKFTAKHGLINSRGNALAFADDSSYYLLCSLEVLDEDNNLKCKADMFTKRTIKPSQVVTSVDTASEALAVSIAEKAKVDMEYMSALTGKTEAELASDLRGVIYMDFNRRPDGSYTWRTADDFLSGNVREKLRYYENALRLLPDDAERRNAVADNVAALRMAQPKDLDASEIEVRLGATWIDKSYIQQFMVETFDPPYYLRRSIEVNYSPFTAEWNITGKSQPSYSDVNAYMTYGTDRANAYKILEDTLNLRDVRIYDTVTDPDGKERRVLNSKETTLAQQKQQAIKDAFTDWIWKDPDRRQTLVARYNELFNSTRPREYDGSHIVFSGMNPEIKLREHQLNAVAHILYGGNTLLAHEVGAGKTFEMVAAAMESKRLGLCQKPMFVVPNHLTEQWASEFLRLYPSANILAATKKDFEPKNRKKFCARIATGDYDAIIIGHSQFERIPVSQERQERLLQEQIWEIEEGLEELKASRAERFTIKSLERTKKGLETRLKKLQDSSRKDDVITFEQLGVDRLYVDEAHSFKNLFLYTKMRNVAGLSTSDAQKSSDMLLKCRYIDEITDSRGVVFATGTPVSNSMTELYTMMRYLQHDVIREKGLAHFDCWASTFGETTTAIELAPEGTGYRARTRFAKFFNLPELMNLFKEAADIKTADQLNLPTPTAIYHNEVAQPTEIQQAMVQELSERAAAVHTGKVDPSEDNMLRITSDGRKLGLDQRIINPNLPDEPTSKVNMCVENIYRIWEEGQADKLTQLVFCDLSTPKPAAKRAAKAPAGNLDSPEIRALEMLAEKDGGTEEEVGFTVYDDIREKLVARGIPREQIVFIHEANTEARKKELFSKVRSGQVRVLMGSTFKMGAGMNVQDRLIALHDLDAPWRPGDLEQRSGRIIRQGNRNPEVHIYRYVTEATFDAYLWQTLENKQKFISQIMTSKSPVRACDDIDETALSYAEIKALCAGDERIKEKMDLDVDVARLKLMKANHQSQQYRLEDNLLRYFPEQIEQNKKFIEGFHADMKILAEHPHPKDGFAGMTVRGDVLTDKENAGAALVDAFKEVKGLDPVPIGTYRGFSMSLTLEDFGRDYVLTLKGQMTHRVTLGKDPRGNLTRIDNALNGMADRLATVQSKLESLYSQMETAKAELGKPFPQEEELRTKSARLAELNIELNIDDKTPLEAMAEEAPTTEIAKTAKPSVLQKLHSYGVQSRPEPKKSMEEVR